MIDLRSDSCRLSRPPVVVASLLGAVVALVAPARADAQVVEASDFPVERFRTALDARGILGTEWAEVPRHLTWDVGVWFGASDDPLVTYDGEGTRSLELVHRRITATATASIALRDRVQLGIELPLILSQQRGTQQADTMLGGIGGSSLGDVRVAAKLALLREARDGLGLAVIPAITVPSGGGEEYRGDGAVTFAPELALSRTLGRVRLAANLGYRERTRAELADLEVTDELTARLGAGVRATSAVQIDAGLATATRADAPFAESNTTYAEALAGVTVALHGVVSIGAVTGIGLTSGFGAPDWRAVLALRLSPHPR